jgi:hypothetical protein
MNEIPKQFEADFIQRHLEMLPDAATCDVDIIEHTVYEGFDRNAEIRPAYVNILYLVFTKNEERNGWVFAGYRY